MSAQLGIVALYCLLDSVRFDTYMLVHVHTLCLRADLIQLDLVLFKSARTGELDVGPIGMCGLMSVDKVASTNRTGRQDPRTVRECRNGRRDPRQDGN